jgi:hypothetical protein
MEDDGFQVVQGRRKGRSPLVSKTGFCFQEMKVGGYYLVWEKSSGFYDKNFYAKYVMRCTDKLVGDDGRQIVFYSMIVDVGLHENSFETMKMSDFSCKKFFRCPKDIFTEYKKYKGKIHLRYHDRQAALDW